MRALNFLKAKQVFFSKRAFRHQCICIGVPFLLFCCFVFLHFFSNVEVLLSFYLPNSGMEKLPITVQCNIGRLGNQMCTYATLYGLSVLNDRPFIALYCNLRQLSPYFDGLSAPDATSTFLYVKWNPWPLSPYYREEDATIPSNSNYIEGYRHPCSYTFFDHVADDLRREFRFVEPIRQHASNVLYKANVNGLTNVTYVGVHVRRGDYQERWLDMFGGLAVNMEYFQKGTEYFRKKYEIVVFVIVSDDRVWCAQHLSGRFGMYVSEEGPTPAHDLAVLAACNHTLMTYGTFGFWGGYLAGGEVVYFDRFLKPNTSFTNEKFLFDKMYPPRWKGLITVSDTQLDAITVSDL